MALPSEGTAMISIGLKALVISLRSPGANHFGRIFGQIGWQSDRCKRLICATSFEESLPRISIPGLEKERSPAHPPRVKSIATATTAARLIQDLLIPGPLPRKDIRV